MLDVDRIYLFYIVTKHSHKCDLCFNFYGSFCLLPIKKLEK